MRGAWTLWDMMNECGAPRGRNKERTEYTFVRGKQKSGPGYRRGMVSMEAGHGQWWQGKGWIRAREMTTMDGKAGSFNALMLRDLGMDQGRA